MLTIYTAYARAMVNEAERYGQSVSDVDMTVVYYGDGKWTVTDNGEQSDATDDYESVVRMIAENLRTNAPLENIDPLSPYRDQLDVEVKLKCGCKTHWHDADDLQIGVYAWCNTHEDTSVQEIHAKPTEIN